MDDGNFVKLKGEALFVIGLRDDYATRRNGRKRMKVDDDEVRNNKPT